MEIKISIIIPTYNAEKYIKKCMESIINQTYRNIEILVINDASTDETLEIVKEYKNKDDRIKIISNESNMGADYTRKQGIKNANGDFIMFVDSDDWIDYETIEKCINAVDKYNCDIVRFCVVREILKQNRKIYHEQFFKKERCVSKEEFKDQVYPEILRSAKYNPIWGQLIKRKLIQDVTQDSGIVMAEDYYFNILLIDKIESIAFIPDFLYHYRFTTNSITNKKTKESIRKNLEDDIKVYYELFNCIEKWNMKEEYKKVVALRILEVLTCEFMKIFLVEKIENKEIEEIYYDIVDNNISKVRKTLTISDINRYKGISKRYIKDIYSGKLKKFIFRGKLIYRSEYKIKQFIKKILFK